ncbi:RAD55 family ATPase [Methanolobus profundi]|uniref:RecA-superfamily ATPase, KaiC/GvpD/RAD55 family n=1 Tax=Methanolobus profundi TaxID=487685 RepID=A0A1I4RCG6_9EURY|nr:ATPase domain-containing protein [Methanolobus profundi]SFM49978.1 RecA-superfamily ATPase, KaiC/GvpD/RAD55 family [Methanolobus profundi]
MTRISTGITDLDKKLQGGFPEGECILITGEPGTGKTIIGIQFLYNACKEGKRCALIATEETPEKIIIHGKALGFDLEPFVNTNQLSMVRFLEIRAFDIGEGTNQKYIEIDDINNLLHMMQEDIDVIVLDNMGTFSIGVDLKEFRDKVDALAYLLSKQNRTSLIMMDATAHELTHRITEYSTYGTIKLTTKENPYTGKMERYMYMPKMRGTKVTLELINYDITEEGIKLLSSKSNK